MTKNDLFTLRCAPQDRRRIAELSGLFRCSQSEVIRRLITVASDTIAPEPTHLAEPQPEKGQTLAK